MHAAPSNRSNEELVQFLAVSEVYRAHGHDQILTSLYTNQLFAVLYNDITSQCCVTTLVFLQLHGYRRSDTV
jgi:hypothetical protein